MQKEYALPQVSDASIAFATESAESRWLSEFDETPRSRVQSVALLGLGLTEKTLLVCYMCAVQVLRLCFLSLSSYIYTRSPPHTLLGGSHIGHCTGSLSNHSAPRGRLATAPQISPQLPRLASPRLGPRLAPLGHDSRLGPLAWRHRYLDTAPTARRAFRSQHRDHPHSSRRPRRPRRDTSLGPGPR